jgi:CubicO group peptidase (beta-lactamase class C family)
MNEMRLSRRTLMRGAALLGAGTAFPRMAFANAVAEARYPHVTAFIDGYVVSGKLPGMIAALGWGSSEAPMDVARGTGTTGSAVPLNMDSLFRIYSMSKPITGMAAMMLVDEGKLSLDQPLSDILPKFARMQVQVTPDGSITDLRPAKTAITVRQLLTHSAGLGYPLVQKGPIKDAYERAGVIAGRVGRIPIPGLATSSPLDSLAMFADHLAALPLVYEPGTRWSYSCGLDLMGRVIEVASGQPFDAFLQSRLFDPLGMTSTWFRVPQSQRARLTTNYGVLGTMTVPLDRAEDSVFLDPPGLLLGGAGLVSSPRDYDRFLSMLLGFGRVGKTRVMSEAAVRMGISNLLDPAVVTAGTTVAGAGFGAGGRVGLGPDLGTFGWGGAAGTIAFVNTRLGNRAGLYTQFMPMEAYPVHKEFPKAVVADLLKTKAAA